MTPTPYKQPVLPWKETAFHEETGRKAFQHTVDFQHTGNNEGTQTVDVKVEEADGTVLAKTFMRIEWEYYGWVRVEFSSNGESFTVSGSDGQIKTRTLAPPALGQD